MAAGENTCFRSGPSHVVLQLCAPFIKLCLKWQNQFMRREVRREAKLPAFSLTLVELELLWSRLTALFDTPEGIYGTIDITLPSEQLEFRSVEELKNYNALPPQITRFWIRLAKGERNVNIRMGQFLSRPEVSAHAETEVWCAGAIECVTTFTRAHKLWYSWFLAMPLGWALVLISNVPTIVLALLPKGTQMERPLFLAWLAILATLGVLYVARSWLLPSCVIQVSTTEGIFKRRASELSLLIALISAVLTIVGWFVGK